MGYFLKAALALVAGIAITVVVSYGLDALLKALKIMPRSGLPKQGSTLLIVCIIMYRTAAIVAGSFVTAKLAPSNPMVFVFVLAVIGTLGSIGSAISPKTKDLGPAWYSWALVAVGIPAALLGGLLAL